MESGPVTVSRTPSLGQDGLSLFTRLLSTVKANLKAVAAPVKAGAVSYAFD
jgi:hypothetical protein